MKKITKFLFIAVLINCSNQSLADDTTILKYHNEQVGHTIYITDGKVVGGKSVGGFKWEVSGGAYDGRNLHVTFTSPQRSGCKSWFTQIYEVNETGPRMLVNVDKCGQVRSDLNKQHRWDYAPGT